MDTRAGALILLVEDERLIARSEAKTIRSFGYQVVAVNTGAAALDQVRNNPEISLVMMDMDLGQGLDGPETCRKILAQRDLPIIFLTAHGEKHYIDQVRQIPHYGYLLKNTSDVILESCIEMAFRLFESQKQAQVREAHLLRAEKVAGFGSWALDLNTGLTIASEGARAIYGFSGDSWTMDEIKQAPLPEYRPLLDRALSALIHEGAPYDVEFIIRRGPDRELRHIHSNASYDTAGNCVTGTIQDVTDLKTTEHRLKKEQDRLRNLLNVTGTGTWEWNIQTGEDTFDANSAALLGYAPAELQPNSFETWMSLKHPDDHREADALLQAHLRGETDVYAYESRMKHKNGSWVWVLGRGKITERDPDGKPLIMSGIHIDITQLRQAEKRIEELLAEKELLLKEVHHRVKNHLNTICSLLALQADTVKEEAAAALIDAGNRVAGMLLLYDELYRSDYCGDISVRVFLGSLVDRVVAAFPNGPAVRVRKDIVDVPLDTKRLQPLGIIVNELLTNSLKYAFSGASGGIAGGTIDVSLTSEHGRLTLVYADDGPGLPEGVDFDHSGGFGLMLVRELTQQLRGDIRLERGAGTRFVLEFKK